MTQLTKAQFEQQRQLTEVFDDIAASVKELPESRDKDNALWLLQKTASLARRAVCVGQYGAAAR